VIYADGRDKYEGQWKNGKRHGVGFETDKNGRKIKGQWIKGVIVISLD
jgi:hypothetical protein